MSSNQCIAAIRNSLRRCKHISVYESKYCGIHDKILKVPTYYVRNYDGSEYSYSYEYKKVFKLSDPIYYWEELNRYYKLSDYDNILKIIRTGSVREVVHLYMKKNIFSSYYDLCGFFSDDKYSVDLDKEYHKEYLKEYLDEARSFLGVWIVLERQIEKVVRIQALSRGYISRRKMNVKLFHIKNINNIRTIQRFWRRYSWLKNLPVSLEEMVRRYIPKMKDIIFLQTFFRYYIKKKVQRSYGCPYSGDEYWDIPRDDRVCYRYKIGDIKYWRYYNLQWLHEDFLHQIDKKRFVVEPVLKKEFPEEFVVEIARSVWKRTRLDKKFLEQESDMNYNIYRDWSTEFKRRSLYSFSLMLFDVADMLELSIDTIHPTRWRDYSMRDVYHMFYYNNSNIIYQIARKEDNFTLENDIFFITSRVLSPETIFMEHNCMDILSGWAIVGLFIIYNHVKHLLNDKEVVADIVVTGFFDMSPDDLDISQDILDISSDNNGDIDYHDIL